MNQYHVNQYQYTGKKRPEPGEQDAGGKPLYPYIPDEELVEAVNLALYLNRPLLLKGEPGCGKTQLACAVAYELKWKLQAWYVKSTSRARDGLYTYDAVARLRDAQLVSSGMIKDAEEIHKISDPATYVKWGELGKAFLNEEPTVVLIDEIDKADIDFPNDLLLELDERRFFVEETQAEVQAKSPLLVFITSNDEKDLPDAFLRRCLFHYIQFPAADRLKQILGGLFPETEEKVVNQAIVRFRELREQMKDKGSGKRVSTSELIDWFKVINQHPTDEALQQLQGKLPYAGVLLKSWDDHQRYLARSGKG